MKPLIRLFFKTLRILLTPFMLLWEVVSSPKPITRIPEEQQQVDEECRRLALYQFKSCPFCIKVRRTIKHLSLNIETRDAQRDPRHREELLKGGGEIKVPCLRITNADNTVSWLYESDDINRYLRERFTPPAPLQGPGSSG